MMLLFFYLALALGVSFLCSIMEAVLLSITPAFAAALEASAPRSGALVRRLKVDIDRPLSAILSLNTIAHTVGAAGVGAQALVVFGRGSVALTSAILTLCILVLSEIIPKTLGAVYWRRLAVPTARLLLVWIGLLYPLVYLSQILTRLISRSRTTGTVSREEVRALADLGLEEGVLREHESRILKNLLRLGRLKADSVMTPRPVMFTLPEDRTVREVLSELQEIRFSRIPITGRDPDDICSFVLKSDILLNASLGDLDTTLRDLGRKILVVPETATLVGLFEQVLDRREHIALVVDEYGGVSGLVTMEDIVETLLGLEIVDETDSIVDMQELARRKWAERARAMGLITDKAIKGRRKDPCKNPQGS